MWLWCSHEVAAGTDAVQLGAWDGEFLANAKAWALLPPGEYLAHWQPVEGPGIDLESLRVEVMAQWTDHHENDSPWSAWVHDGEWKRKPSGFAATNATAYMFREAAMHGEFKATFVPCLTSNNEEFGLIIRHYNAAAHVRLIGQLTATGGQLQLQCFKQHPGEMVRPQIIVRHEWVNRHEKLELSWSFNGSQHVVRMNGSPVFSARENFMGGVDVVGLLASPGICVEQSELTTSQQVSWHTIKRPQYSALIRPGNIRRIELSDSGLKPLQVFWESGIQYGHIGGSEIKFTQAARQHMIVDGPVCTTVRWDGPMPKFVEQSDDVRGWASGKAHFYDDRVVIHDEVLTYVNRSVGPDIDMFSRMMHGPARVAVRTDRQFHDWILPDDGQVCHLNELVDHPRFPVTVIFPMGTDDCDWWLIAVIHLQSPEPSTGECTCFGWRCPHRLTSSHDFRVTPTVPGQLYLFETILSWYVGFNHRDAEQRALLLRDDWLTPATIIASRGRVVCYHQQGEQPREAMYFCGAFDRSVGAYVVEAQDNGCELTLDPGDVVCRSLTLVIRNLHGANDPTTIRCDVDHSPLQMPDDMQIQCDDGSQIWIRIKRPIGHPTHIEVSVG
ncbi:MAG: hypothetical protein IT445_03300 [Phycisphaeraceae bacterium]|nr:hypothetical protein [Phycisphaeraceae bacterium]